ncbi:MULTISPECIES: TnpV protein [Anaerobutyricum]|nr:MULTISPECIES: TnpV protein [Anaerobutyricum]
MYPDLGLRKQTEGYIGKYSLMREKYLKEHKKSTYQVLKMGDYEGHMIEIQRRAEERMDELLPELMKTAGATEELKAADQMKWVGIVNNCKQQAEEMIKEEIIFS